MYVNSKFILNYNQNSNVYQVYREHKGTLLMLSRKCEGTPKKNGRKSLIDNFPDSFFLL